VTERVVLCVPAQACPPIYHIQQHRLAHPNTAATQVYPRLSPPRPPTMRHASSADSHPATTSAASSWSMNSHTPSLASSRKASRPRASTSTTLMSGSASTPTCDLAGRWERARECMARAALVSVQTQPSEPTSRPLQSRPLPSFPPVPSFLPTHAHAPPLPARRPWPGSWRVQARQRGPPTRGTAPRRVRRRRCAPPALPC
jgi:hypothetical protein